MAFSASANACRSTGSRSPGARPARGLLAGCDDLLDDEIGFGGRRRADVDGFIRHLDVKGVIVGVRIDGDGRNPHAARGLDDAACDLAAIGDQNFLEHKRPGLIPSVNGAACGAATHGSSLIVRRPNRPYALGWAQTGGAGQARRCVGAGGSRRFRGGRRGDRRARRRAARCGRRRGRPSRRPWRRRAARGRKFVQPLQHVAKQRRGAIGGALDDRRRQFEGERLLKPVLAALDEPRGVLLGQFTARRGAFHEIGGERLDEELAPLLAGPGNSSPPGQRCWWRRGGSGAPCQHGMAQRQNIADMDAAGTMGSRRRRNCMGDCMIEILLGWRMNWMSMSGGVPARVVQRAGDGRPGGGAAVNRGRGAGGNAVGFASTFTRIAKAFSVRPRSAWARSHSACAPLTRPGRAALPHDVIGDRLDEEGGSSLRAWSPCRGRVRRALRPRCASSARRRVK